MKKIFDKYNLYFLLIILYCFLISYFTPPVFARFAFLPLLVFALFSRTNAIWIVLLLVFYDTPMFLFHGGLKESLGRVPIYPFFGLGFIMFSELLAIILILKSILMNITKTFYIKYIIIFFLFVIFSIFIGILYGLSLDGLIQTIRRIFFWIYILILPTLLKKEIEWITFFRIIFPFSFLLFIDQASVILTGSNLVSLFNPNIKHFVERFQVLEGFEKVSRVWSGEVITFIGFCGALIIYFEKHLVDYFRKSYIIFVMVFFYLVVILSATRGPFISHSFMILISFFIFFQRKFIIRSIPIYILIFLFLNQLFGYFFTLRYQIELAWKRFKTIEYFIQGDITAGGTLHRVSDYTPKLLQYFYKNPFGYGFSDVAYNLENDHVGLLNPLIILGIQGYLVLLWVIFNIMKKHFNLWRELRELSVDSNFKNSQLISIIIFIGAFIIHSTSRQIFGFNLNTNYNIMVAIIFAISDWIYRSGINSYNLSLNKK